LFCFYFHHSFSTTPSISSCISMQEHLLTRAGVPSAVSCYVVWSRTRKSPNPIKVQKKKKEKEVSPFFFHETTTTTQKPMARKRIKSLALSNTHSTKNVNVLHKECKRKTGSKHQLYTSLSAKETCGESHSNTHHHATAAIDIIKCHRNQILNTIYSCCQS
jgi:hypothetical protein